MAAGDRPEIDADETAIRRAVRRQLDACEQWIKTSTTPRVRYEVVEDNDVSATKRRVRPAFARMLADAETGNFDLILSYHLDRLTRTIKDLLPLLALAVAKRNPVGTTTVSGALDLTTDMGRMLAGILAVVAQGEVDRKSARQMLGNDQRASEGRPSPGGRRAFGYEPDLITLRESEAVHVRAAFDALLAGASIRSIAATMAANGVLTVLGHVQTRESVKQMLTNPRYAGIRVHRGEEVGPARWAPIVAESTFRAATGLLADPSRRTGNSPTGGRRVHLLTGLGLCGVCGDGTTVVGGSRGAGQPVYQCRTGKHLARASEPVDEFVQAGVLTVLSRPEAAELLVDQETPDLAALTTERLTLVQRQNDAADEYAAGGITRTQLRMITATLTERIEEIDTATSRPERVRILDGLVHPGDAVKAGAAWDRLSLDRRQAVMRELGTWTLLKGKVGGSGARYRTPADYRVTFAPHA